MKNEKEMYPPELKTKKEQCYCCKRVKEGTYIKKDSSDCDNEVFICHSCNHLELKNEKEK